MFVGNTTIPKLFTVINVCHFLSLFSIFLALSTTPEHPLIFVVCLFLSVFKCAVFFVDKFKTLNRNRVIIRKQVSIFDVLPYKEYVIDKY